MQLTPLLILTNINQNINQYIFKSHFLLESGRSSIFEIVMVSKILHFFRFLAGRATLTQ